MNKNAVKIILVAATALYALVWSYIGISKFLALNAYVFDLGINAERGWLILHTNLGMQGYLITFLHSGIVYLLSPLTGTGNFFAMIIFQAVSIASGGPALYLIAKEKGLRNGTSLLVALTYFLYFPLYGALWFDFHYQAFFVPLFLFGYLAYSKEKYYLAALIFILSGIVRFPYCIFPLAFAILELVLIHRRNRQAPAKGQTLSLSILTATMLFLTIGGTLSFGLAHSVPGISQISYSTVFEPLLPRIMVIILFLIPLLFLPVFSYRWMIFTFPAFYLILSSSYIGYSYTHIFQGQYVSGIVPFLLLGFIDALSSKRFKAHKISISGFRKKLHVNGNALNVAMAALLFLVLLNAVFAPFGPLNSYSPEPFNYHGNTNYNLSQYNELSKMISLIPSNDTYVAYQNNIPEVMPRLLPSNGSIIMGGNLGNLGNFSIVNAMDNSWPTSRGGQIVYTPIDYIIADVANPNYFSGNHSMASLVKNAYASGKYGTIAEGYGLIMLEWNYTGKIFDYSPQNMAIPDSLPASDI